VEKAMLRLTTQQRDFWEDLLPPEARRLSPELQAIDAFLDDERFLASFQARFPSTRGRQTIPMETYLRLMFLKMRYQLGYESLVAEVTDSVGWRRFCRISLSGRVPDASTLIKLTNGPCQGLAQDVHDALIQKLTEQKVLRGRTVRVDTTVVEADIHYPTDVQLLADGVRVVTRTIKQLQHLGAEIGGTFRDVGRSITKRLLRLGKGLKQDKDRQQATRSQVTTDVLGITEQMMRRARRAQQQIAEWAQGQGDAVARRVRQRLDQLETWLERTDRVIDQTQQVLGGTVHIKDRLISVFDPDARPIKKGNLRRPTEFGYKVCVTDEDRGFVTDYEVHRGNPADGSLLVPAVTRHTERVGRAPKEVATDAGMGQGVTERDLEALGVERCSIPKIGKKTEPEREKERSSWFRRLQRFRAGGEGRISLLKRKYGWRHSRVRGLERVETWVGWGAITHNLAKYGHMQAAAA
jgi:IS5 family transposase